MDEMSDREQGTYEKGKVGDVSGREHTAEDEEEDIRMPSGPAPSRKTVDDDASDVEGIVMPQGPPPPRPPTGPGVGRGHGQTTRSEQNPPLPPGAPPPHAFDHHNQWNMGHAAPQSYGPPRPTMPMHRPQRPWPQHHVHPAPAAASHGAPPGPPPARPSAVISAAPQLRNLKREATAFLPTALRKKQATQKAKAAMGGLPGLVNSAPEQHDDQYQRQEADGDDPLDQSLRSSRVDLVATVQSTLTHNAASRPPHSADAPDGNADGGKPDDDYQKFLGDVGDLL